MQCYGQQLKAAAAGQCRVALDCGSGVGRIAEQLLLQHFQEVSNLMRPTELGSSAACQRVAEGLQPCSAAAVCLFIGAVSVCEQVDLIEPSEHLLSKAKVNLTGPGHKCAPPSG